MWDLVDVEWPTSRIQLWKMTTCSTHEVTLCQISTSYYKFYFWHFRMDFFTLAGTGTRVAGEGPYYDKPGFDIRKERNKGRFLTKGFLTRNTPDLNKYFINTSIRYSSNSHTYQNFV